MSSWKGALTGGISDITKQADADSAPSSSSGDDSKYRNKSTPAPTITDSYHKGGRVKRTGPARLKKGERVLTKKQAKRYDRKRGSKK